MTRLDYVIWLCSFLLIPIIFLWFKFHKTLVKYSLTILIIIIIEQVGLIWDLWGVREGIWKFPDGHNLGVRVLGLPVEEYVAFVLFAILVSSMTIVMRFHGPLKIKTIKKVP